MTWLSDGMRGNAAIFTLALVLGGCGSGESPREKARQHLAAGNVAAARIEASTAVQKSPNDSGAYFVLGQVMAAQGDYESADRTLQKAGELGADRAQVDMTRARVLLSAKAYDRILRDLVPSTAYAGEPQAAVLVARGRAQLVTADTTAAKQSFDAALRAVPEMPDALLGQAQLAYVGRDFVQASALLDRILSTHPEHAGASDMKLALLMMQDSSDAAIAGAERSAKRNPDVLNSQLILVELLINAGRFDDAQKHIDRALKVAPKSIEALHTQAVLHYRRGDFVKAVESLHTVLRLRPTHSPSLVLMALTQLARGELSQAEENFRAMARAMPGDTFLARMLGETLLRMGNVKGAIDVFAPALARNTDDPAMLMRAGDAYAALKDFARATELYERAARIRPGDSNALMRSGLARISGGDASRGFALLEQASATQRDGISADFTVALVHIERQQFQEALAAAKRIQAKQPDGPIGFNLVGAVQEMLGDANAARSSFEQSLKRDSEYWPAASNLARLDLAAGRRDAAKAHIDRVLARDARNLDAMGLLMRITGDRGAYVRGLESVRRTDPAALPARLALARAYIAGGLGDAALMAASEAAAIAPGRAEILDVLGSAQLAAGRKGEALSTFRQLAVAAPGSANAQLRLAQTLTALDDRTGAEEAFKKTLALDAKNVDAMAGLARLYALSKRMPDALAIAGRLVQTHPTLPDGRILTGDLQLFQRNFTAAIAEYDAALELAPSGNVLVRKHAARVAAGQKGDEAPLKQWLARHPDDADTRLYLANRRYVDGRYAEAVPDYEAVVRSNPFNSSAFNNLANAYMQVNDKRALEMAEAAHRLKPDDAEILDTYGQLLTRAGKLEPALDALRKAVSRRPDVAAIRANYAVALARSGERVAARAEMQKALATDANLQLDVEARALAK